MPELPEVETTRRGISPHVVGRRIAEVIIRRYDLRRPISPELAGLARWQLEPLVTGPGGSAILRSAARR